MKVRSIRIENLRSIEDVTVNIDSYTCLVGSNGSGKSTVLCALNIFFREMNNAPTDMSSLSEEDFHKKNTGKPIKVTVTFHELTQEAQVDFSNYFRAGELVICAEAKFDPTTKSAEVKQYGMRRGMLAFAPFFEAEGDGAKVPELKLQYQKILGEYPDLPPHGTKEAMKKALWDFETNHPELCELIPSEDHFYGVSRGANRLEKYIQWIYVPAVKDATTEEIETRNTALGKLLNRALATRTTISDDVTKLRDDLRLQYEKLLNAHKGALTDLSKALKQRIEQWAHPDASIRLEWRQDPQKIKLDDPLAQIVAGEYGFEGSLARFGHGMQRSYLLALLHELAVSGDESVPRLILGCEEPELYQHPPQARYLASVLRELAGGNAQVIVTTHSPLFISGAAFEDVRMVHRGIAGQSKITQATFDQISKSLQDRTGERLIARKGMLAQIHQALTPQMNEMFFSSSIVLVEGLEDVAYINAYIELSGNVREFRKKGIHIIPANGKSEIVRPLLIAQALSIPVFIVFDADADTAEANGRRAAQEKDNRILLALTGNSKAAPMPTEDFWGDNAVMWCLQLDKAIDAGISNAEAWTKAKSKAETEFGQVGGLKKNVLAIGAKLAYGWDAGERYPSLQKMTESILHHFK